MIWGVWVNVVLVSGRVSEGEGGCEGRCLLWGFADMA